MCCLLFTGPLLSGPPVAPGKQMQASLLVDIEHADIFLFNDGGYESRSENTARRREDMQTQHRHEVKADSGPLLL